MTRVMGIDPGVHGAIATVNYRTNDDFDILDVGDLPIASGLFGKIVNVCVLRDYLYGMAPEVVVIEYPLWAKHDGAAQVSTAWQNYGRVAAVIELSCSDHAKFIQVPPSTWKADMGLTLGKEATRRQKKAHALEVARKLFGEEPYLKRAKDNDRAEALLLSYWGFITG